MNKNLYWPGGNPTLLIEDTSSSISSNEFSSIAAQELSDVVEQVGFIRKDKEANLKLEMMGGEFCINAIRSLALWNYEKTGNTNSGIICSGSKDVLECSVENWVSIRIPKSYSVKQIDDKSFLIKLNGIAHFVVKDTCTEAGMKKELQTLMSLYKKEIKEFPAVGLIRVDGIQMKPLIYVKQTNSWIFETSCGSGGLAAFIVSKQDCCQFIQPSGSILIVSSEESSFILKGEVRKIS